MLKKKKKRKKLHKSEIHSIHFHFTLKRQMVIFLKKKKFKMKISTH